MPMLCVVLKNAFPQDVRVPLHCAIDATHTIRNTLVHCKKASVDQDDYKKFTSEIDHLIKNTKEFFNNPEFNGTIDRGVNMIKKKCYAMSFPDASVAFNSWAIRQNEIENKLDQHHAENIIQHAQTQEMVKQTLDRLTVLENQLGQKLPVHVLVEIEGQSNRPKEEIDELHRRFVQLINACIEMKGTPFDNQQRDSINESLCQVLRDLPQNGIRIVGAENKCIVLRVQCQSMSAFKQLYEASLSGELTKWFAPLENEVRKSWHASYIQTVTIRQEMVPGIIQKIAIELSKKVFDENVEVFNSGGSTRIALPCVDMLTTAVGKECDLGTASALIRAIQSYGQSENFKATHVIEGKAAYSKHFCEQSRKWPGFRRSCVYVEEISQSYYTLLDECGLDVQNVDRKKCELQLLQNVRKQNCSVEIFALSNTITGIRMFENHLKFAESNTDIENIPQHERMIVVITFEDEKQLLHTYLSDHKKGIFHVCVVFVNERGPDIPYVQPGDFGVQCFICQTRPELISNSIGVLLERNVMHFLRSQVQTLLLFREQVEIQNKLETPALKDMFQHLRSRFEIVFVAKAMDNQKSSADTEDVLLHQLNKVLKKNASHISNVLQMANALYKRRKTKIPEEEREDIQDIPNPVNELVEGLQAQTYPHVIGFEVDSGALNVYVDFMIDESTMQRLDFIFSKILKREALPYKVVFAKLKLYSRLSCGSRVSCDAQQCVGDVHGAYGTLGGFVEHNNISSTSICAVTTRHLAILSGNNSCIVDGVCIGKWLKNETDVTIDIAAAHIFNEFVPNCKFAFQDENGYDKPCSLYDNNRRDLNELRGLHVHIWGANSKPGTGMILSNDCSKGSVNFFLVTDLPGQNAPFCDSGDSGAFVLTESIDDDSMTAIGIVVGEMMKLGSSGKNTEKKKYFCHYLHEGLDQLAKAHKGTFKLLNCE
ncbi:uncharacterized protein LOC128240285 isoform X2 [Mya arenaria]|nr:uncharacterized protein LOC128240285 isoform X2 [Mya arenaria]